MGNLGFPSFLPAQAGYYNPNQIYQVPSDDEISKDIFNLPHGLADINNFHGSNLLHQPIKNHNNFASPFPQSALGLKLPTIFNSKFPIHPATNPLTGIINNNYPSLQSGLHPNNQNRFPPRRPNNFPTPEFLPFPPIGPSNRPGPEITPPTTTASSTTTTQNHKDSQVNKFKKPPKVPNSHSFVDKNKKKKPAISNPAPTSDIYNEVFNQETYDDEFNQDEEENGNFAGLEPFKDIELPETIPTKNSGKFSAKPLQQLQNTLPGELTPSDVKGRIESLDEILTSLHIKTPGCQRRLICHLAKDPEKFTPLSHLVLDHLELQGLEGNGADLSRADSSAHMSRYLDLLQAMEAGKHRLCYKYSDVCKYKGEDMINSTGLRAWKLMYRVLTMKALALRDGTQF